MNNVVFKHIGCGGAPKYVRGGQISCMKCFLHWGCASPHSFNTYLKGVIFHWHVIPPAIPSNGESATTDMPKKNDTALVECMGKEKYKDMQSLKSAAICKFNEAVKILKKADKCLGISDTEERESETLQAIIKNTEEYIDDLRD